jgi:3-hydroxyacyl-CoA dehydrogenase / 3-hydroxy-2-methylbutyryl-CoA dehydrogenase
LDASKIVVLVTGGASGLGAATVRMAAAAGGKAAIVDLPTSSGAELAAELGENARFFPANIKEPAEVSATVAAVVTAFGRVDVAVSCAGVPEKSRFVRAAGETYSVERMRRIMDVNVSGLFDVVRHSARAMLANPPGEDGERGVIINVASIEAFEGQTGLTVYSASKAAVVGMTVPLARELGPHGIRVLTIAPGSFVTGMFSEASEESQAMLAKGHIFPKRFGDPAEFASLVKQMIENRFINGETVRLDAAVRLTNMSSAH